MDVNVERESDFVMTSDSSSDDWLPAMTPEREVENGFFINMKITEQGGMRSVLLLDEPAEVILDKTQASFREKMEQMREKNQEESQKDEGLNRAG